MDTVFEVIYFLLDKSFYLLKPSVDLSDCHVILYVVLHLSILACSRRLQAT